MVDTFDNTTKENDGIHLLLDWLGTFKGFHNKLTLLSANSTFPHIGLPCVDANTLQMLVVVCSPMPRPYR
jgi:hypothetical protein